MTTASVKNVSGVPDYTICELASRRSTTAC